MKLIMRNYPRKNVKKVYLNIYNNILIYCISKGRLGGTLLNIRFTDPKKEFRLYIIEDIIFP